MKIEIKEKDKNFFDECLYIRTYINKVMKKPKKKVCAASKFFLRGLILYIIYSLIFIIWGIVEGFDVTKIICSVVFVWFTCIMIYNNYIIRKNINMYMNDGAIKSEFEINEKAIILKNNDKSIELNWDLVKYVIINKESISFIPITQTFDSIVMFISTKYKDDVMDAIKKYKKEELVIDNSNLYK